MKVIVAGRNPYDPVLLETSEASAVLIETDDGRPTVIFKLTDDGKGWIRLVKGEDKNFGEIAKELGLI
jgi:hypothetical protein